MSWSPGRYSQFERERTRPVRDLLAQVASRHAELAVDLGCGPGNSTEVLIERFPDAAVRGIDSSGAMIEAARQRLPGVAFEIAEIADWSRRSESFDVILSNAALQWVPGHASLLPALLARLRPGGSLAVQMPDNLDEPAHRLMREVAASGPWAAKLAGMSGREDRHDVEWYYRTLRPACTAVDIWRTTYHHPLAGGARAVVEWFESTGLRPYLQPLDETERRDFLAAYERAVGAAYPAMADGTVLLPFPRLFFTAIR